MNSDIEGHNDAEVEAGGRKGAGGMASISVQTWSTVSEEPEHEEEYSVSEYFGSFTVLTPTLNGKAAVINDDTDIEADDDFDEYSEVTFENKVYCDRKLAKFRTEKSDSKPPVSSPSITKHKPCLHTRCSTQCASTYNNSRSRRKTLSALSYEKQIALKKNVVSEDSDESSIASPIGKRKISTFKIERVPETKLIEGTYKHSGSINYEDYLSAIGTGPCSQDLVMRAGMVLRINQEPDKQWRISTETMIRAKSVKGYRTNNRKWTENKFKIGEPKPELVDDWDQRLVVTTLTVNTEGTMITLNQAAEKDMASSQDSVVVLEVEEDEPDTLIMTCMAGEVVGWRKFDRQAVNSKFAERKISSPY